MEKDIKQDQFNSWLLITFDYGKKDTNDLIRYQNELEEIVNPSGLGDVDGHDVATDLSDGSFWIICKDAFQVFDLIKDSLLKTHLVKVKEVKKREQNEEQYSTIFNFESQQ